MKWGVELPPPNRHDFAADGDGIEDADEDGQAQAEDDGWNERGVLHRGEHCP